MQLKDKILNSSNLLLNNEQKTIVNIAIVILILLLSFQIGYNYSKDVAQNKTKNMGTTK